MKLLTNFLGRRISFICLALILTQSACTVGRTITVTLPAPTGGTTVTTAHDDNAATGYDDEVLVLPSLTAVTLAPGEKLRLVATTSIIGDVVAQVGGNAIELTTLMPPGQDPHNYAPSATALTAVANAHVIFVNGWNLEEGLLRDLANIAGANVPMIPVAAGIEPLATGAAYDDDDGHGHDDDDDHGPIDPHTWFDARHMMQWVDNIAHSLGKLDPDRAAVYEGNAAVYQEQLVELDNYIRAQTALIPATRRQLVTNHDNLGYFAHAYGFTIAGTILPGGSTLAEPSARDLAGLTDMMRSEGVCAIFVETIANDRLAQVVARELAGDCSQVQVLSLYTDALGAPGSGADSYIGMMRANTDTIVAGLKGE
jgi:ABC-type Zn uptake system ZnuABC Zn-binding protein ZnuA